MRGYESQEELVKEIEKRANLFIGEFDDIPPREAHTLKEGIDRTPAQMIAYQLGWMSLLLQWESDERAGLRVTTPSPDYKWNDLGGLYQSFDDRWAHQDLSELVEEFRTTVTRVIGLVYSFNQDELFTPGKRQWASSTPSSWPVWKWIHINTVAPFTTFRTRIRKWKKL